MERDRQAESERSTRQDDSPRSGGPSRSGGPPWRRGPQWRGGPPWRGGRFDVDDRESAWSQERWNSPNSRRRRLHGRVVFALLIFGIEAGGAHWADRNQASARALDHGGYLLLAIGCLALIYRVRWRIPMLAVTIASIVAYVVLGYPDGPVFLASIVSIIGALRARHRYGTWITLAAGYAVYVVLGRIFPTIGGLHVSAPSLPTAILVAAWIIVACAVGEGIRNRTERIAEIARMHAEQQRVRDEQQRRQASEERLRIAQELHDVIGHHLSLINVQAGVGLHLMDDDPAQARESLRAIKLASAEALGEVRTVLGMLRDRDERAPRSPAPGLANLRTLVDDAHTTIEGDRVPLPPDVDRAAFRIIQESLTNVRRHAGDAATAYVVLSYQPSQLRIVVSDDGVGPTPASSGAAGRGANSVDVAGADSAAGGPGAVAARGSAGAVGSSGASSGGSSGASSAAAEAGNGIVGMRTRAEALGGTLTAGAGLNGGFQVIAELPLPDASADRMGDSGPRSDQEDCR